MRGGLLFYRRPGAGDGVPVYRHCGNGGAGFRSITEGWVEEAGAALPDSLPGADRCHVLIMTEETAGWLEELLIQWQISGRYPLVVEIPGIAGRLPGRKTLVDSIREAIGVHV